VRVFPEVIKILYLFERLAENVNMEDNPRYDSEFHVRAPYSSCRVELIVSAVRRVDAKVKGLTVA